MSENIQLTSNQEAYKHPVMLSFKVDLLDKFYDLAGKKMKEVGAHYFSHHLTKNCRQEGHTVSSFMTHPDWQQKYWKHYWDHDPVEKASYPIAQSNGFSIVSWRVVDPDSDSMADRKNICKMQDGFRFDIHHPNGVVENLAFGWEKFDIGRMNRDKLAILSDMITDFRIQHFRLAKEMFDVYPDVEFH